MRRTRLDRGDSRKELNMEKHMSTRTLTGVAIFTAIVIVLQSFSAVIRFGPFSITLALIPIVVGAALYGHWAGAWLGFVFGMVVLLSGDAGPFLAVNPLGTILTVLLKGAGAGCLSGLGADPDRVGDAAVLDAAKDDIGIAYVDAQDHGKPLTSVLFCPA